MMKALQEMKTGVSGINDYLLSISLQAGSLCLTSINASGLPTMVKYITTRNFVMAYSHTGLSVATVTLK